VGDVVGYSGQAVAELGLLLYGGREAYKDPNSAFGEFLREESGALGTKPSIRGRLRDAGLPGGTHEATGPFRFRADPGYLPGNSLPMGPKGGFLDRFGNEWVRGPYHGDPKAGYTYEWDVQLSPSGMRHWGATKPYINVHPKGFKSH